MSGCFIPISVIQTLKNTQLFGAFSASRTRAAVIASVIIVSGLLVPSAGPACAAIFDEATKRANSQASFKTPENFIKPNANALANAHLAHGLPTIPATAKVSEAKPLLATDGDTAISGRVVTTEGASLPGVIVEFQGRKTVSDASGLYLLSALKATTGVLTINANKAGPKNKQDYGYYEVQVTAIAGQTTVLPYLNWLPKIDHKNEVSFPSPTKKEVVITNPALPGLELRLPSGTIVTGVDHKPVRKIGITPIPVDRTPFPLPTNVSVPIYFTVQPGGAVLSGVKGKWVGAQVWYPNYDHQLPNAQAAFFKYDPYQFGWTVYGVGAVSKDQANYVPDAKTRIYNLTSAMINAGNAPPAAAPPTPPLCVIESCGRPRNGPVAAGGRGRPGASPSPPRPGTPGAPADGPAGPPAAKSGPPEPPCCGTPGADPVDLASGYWTDSTEDLSLNDLMPLIMSRTYVSTDTNVRSFGVGMALNYESFLWSANQYTEADLIMPQGSRVHYVRTSSGTGYADAKFTASAGPGPYFQSTIAWNGGGWTLTRTDGTIYEFPEYAPMAFLQDRLGNRISIMRNAGPASPVTSITSPNGRSISFTYTTGVITQAKDNAGRTVTYTYDASKRLQTVTNPDGGVTTYTWDTVHNRITAVQRARQNPSGPPQITNTYDGIGRVQSQTLASGASWGFSYTLDMTGKVIETDATDPNSSIQKITYNSAGYWLTQKLAYGTADEQDYSEVLGGSTPPTACTGNIPANSPTNYPIAETDALGRLTCFTYDTAGNRLTEMKLAGTASSVTITNTYDAFGQITGTTDALGHSVTIGRDALGRPSSITDGMGHVSPVAANADGTIASITNAEGNQTNYYYDHGDLVRVTDPVGRDVFDYADAIGRTISSTNMQGAAYQWTYDPIWGVHLTTDPLQNVTTKNFDADGNVVSLVDPRSTIGTPMLTQFSYDSSDRETTRTDALGNSSTITSYDGNNDILATTDRMTQHATYTFDALGRPKTATYADGHAVAYTWDLGNRLTQIQDTLSSVSNTITRSYTDFDLLAQEQVVQGATTLGTVAYTYDAAGRKATMTVSGQTSISYSWNNANWLTQITQGTNTVGFGYDTAGRRTSLTYPNSVVATYIYDAASNPTSISEDKGATNIGTLTYTYDNIGQIVTRGGSLFTAVLPTATSASASYNASNQLTSWNSVTPTYDLNGNLTSDGVSGYAWDARNRLVSVAGTKTFVYDGIGRRQTVTASGVSITSIYDHFEPVQEQNSSTGNVDLLTGPIADERFTRTDSVNTRTFIADMLGSTTGLTDSAGAVQTAYSYDPYGVTSSSGTGSTNSYQFTGRSNDGGGLYYYRSRYYIPAWGRFISEDPSGLREGPNIYIYANDNPVSANDPNGREWQPIAGIAGLIIIAINEYERFENNSHPPPPSSVPLHPFPDGGVCTKDNPSGRPIWPQARPYSPEPRGRYSSEATTPEDPGDFEDFFRGL